MIASSLFCASNSFGQDVEGLDALIRQFTEVYAAVEEQAADTVNSYNAIYGGAIPGMLKRLDPHSVFFDPTQFEQLRELQSATRKGFGSVVSILPGRVFILQTLPGTPSARSGLTPGDEILAINNIALARLNIDQLVGLLSQSRQKKVLLSIRRQGSPRLIEIKMAPESMESVSVDLFFTVEDGVGYVRAKSFEIDTGQKIKEAIEELGEAGLKGLVLDLRGNRGGIMAAALDTAALFLESGKLIVSVRGRGTETEEVRIPKNVQPYTFPLAVLIDANSASGSEIVAGSIQDHDRGPILGVPSYGKGLVQQVYTLSEGTGLALTTAYYYTPSGRSIQRPLHGGQLTGEEPADPSLAYHTDSGRPVSGGGGIVPDRIVPPASFGRLQIVLEATGVFPVFATEAIRKLPAIDAGFEVSNDLLDDFQAWLAGRSIQPSISDWSTHREWIRSRLRQEIFNQTLGVKKGDEVELRHDNTVREAVRVLRDRE